MPRATTLEDTLNAARTRGVDVALGEDSFDLDRVEDLARLDEWRQVSGEEHTCARTIAWIDEHALWPAA